MTNPLDGLELGEVRDIRGTTYIWVNVRGFPEWIEESEWDNRGWALPYLRDLLARLDNNE